VENKNGVGGGSPLGMEEEMAASALVMEDANARATVACVLWSEGNCCSCCLHFVQFVMAQLGTKQEKDVEKISLLGLGRQGEERGQIEKER
jgi:hypothetical protein